jgi:phage FluMu protein Com
MAREVNTAEEIVDSTSNDALKGKIYKCANCGSFLAFDPTSQKLKCTHCASLYDLVETPMAMEQKYDELSSETGYEPWGDVKTVKCRSCGAAFVLNEFETASSCPFCQATNIVSIDDVPGLKPNGILPFKVSSEEAHKSFAAWIKKKKMAPFDLKKKASKITMKGIYVPIFTFDAETSSSYHIRYGINHTRMVRRNGKMVTQVYTTWHTASGHHNDFFNDVQVEASQYMTDKNLSKIGGFDTDNSVRYHNQYIAGFNAERYSTGLDDCRDIAHGKMDKAIYNSIISKYNYDILDYCNVDTDYSEETYKYVLAPLWTIPYKYKKKVYGCVINGRNGNADGKAPVSALKSTLVGISIAIAIAVIVYLIYRYFM